MTEHLCANDWCHGTTFEVYCDDCLGDGTDPDPPTEAEKQDAPQADE